MLVYIKQSATWHTLPSMTGRTRAAPCSSIHMSRGWTVATRPMYAHLSLHLACLCPEEMLPLHLPVPLPLHCICLHQHVAPIRLCIMCFLPPCALLWLQPDCGTYLLANLSECGMRESLVWDVRAAAYPGLTRTCGAATSPPPPPPRPTPPRPPACEGGEQCLHYDMHDAGAYMPSMHAVGLVQSSATQPLADTHVCVSAIHIASLSAALPANTRILTPCSRC